jgi:release factor glutamine methyltransferase
MTIENISVIQWLRNTSDRLKGKIDTPLSDSRVLLADQLRKDTAWLAAHPEYQLDQNTILDLEGKIARLSQGEPLPYILGWWEFFGFKLKISPAVLIPRPETELLVETALAWLDEHPQVREAWDVGTGSGCIALALVSQIYDLVVHGVDISQSALALAGENVFSNHFSNQVKLHQSDLLSDINVDSIQLLCANLPYIPSKDVPTLDVARYEPSLALDGGSDGLKYIEQLLNQVKNKVVTPYMLLLEIEYRQAENVKILVEQIFPGASINIIFDLAGKSRVISIEG